MVTITEDATTKIESLLRTEDNPDLNIRVFVRGGGCQGFEYGFTFDEIVNEDDFDVSLNKTYKILIDSTSIHYLDGATIDYEQNIMNSQFSIKNPNVKSSCGCESSFSIE